MPAQNVPPAPVSTMTWTSGRASRSSRVAAIPAATAPFTAFRAAGRLMVTTATGPSTPHSTASEVPAGAEPAAGLPGPGTSAAALPELSATVLPP